MPPAPSGWSLGAPALPAAPAPAPTAAVHPALIASAAALAAAAARTEGRPAWPTAPKEVDSGDARDTAPDARALPKAAATATLSTPDDGSGAGAPVPAPAPAWRALLAALCDAGLLAVTFALAIAAEVRLRARLWPGDEASLLDALALWLHTYPQAARDAAVAAMVGGWAYTLMGSVLGPTVGRLAWGLTVRYRGARLSWPRGALRAALAPLSALTFGAGYFYALLDPAGKTLHDRLAGTEICRRARPAPARPAPTA